jgi:cytochrome c-type biogenesis protein CcmE
MTTSKEQQPAISKESYSKEDEKLIISLLNEYSNKLMLVFYKIDKQKKRLTLFFLYFGGLITSVILLLYTVWLEIFTFNSVFASAGLAKTIFRLVLILSILMPVSVFIIFTFYQIKQNIKQLMIDANILALRLEKIIRVASQVHEHVLSNVVSRLELDLRLADAEIALQHCTDLFKKTRRS